MRAKLEDLAECDGLNRRQKMEFNWITHVVIPDRRSHNRVRCSGGGERDIQEVDK